MKYQKRRSTAENFVASFYIIYCNFGHLILNFKFKILNYGFIILKPVYFCKAFGTFIEPSFC